MRLQSLLRRGVGPEASARWLSDGTGAAAGAALRASSGLRAELSATPNAGDGIGGPSNPPGVALPPGRGRATTPAALRFSLNDGAAQKLAARRVPSAKQPSLTALVTEALPEARWADVAASAWKPSLPASPPADGPDIALRHVAARGGVSTSNLVALQRLATEERICVFIRPVNPHAAALIEAGCGTKDMGIHGKSSILPPLSGFIPVDQTFGKKGADPRAAARYSEMNQDALSRRTATSLDLQLDRDRLSQLAASGDLAIEGAWLESGPEAALDRRSGLMTGTDGLRSVRFWGESDGAGRVSIFHAVEAEDGRAAKGDPVRVMGNRAGKPVTADYDLALVAPRIEDFGGEHLPPVKMTSAAEVRSRTGHVDDESFGRHVAEQMASTQVDYARSVEVDGPTGALPKKDLGIIARYTKDLLPKLNRACGRGPGLELFHHGDDAGNPFTDEADLYPMTALLPDAFGGAASAGTVRIIENRDEFKRVMKEMKDSGFMPIANHAWGQDLAQVRADRFEEAKAAVGRHLASRNAAANAPPALEASAPTEPLAAEPPQGEPLPSQGAAHPAQPSLSADARPAPTVGDLLSAIGRAAQGLLPGLGHLKGPPMFDG